MEDFLKKIDEIGLTNNSDYWVIVRAYATSLSDKDLLDVYVSRFRNNVVIESILRQRDVKHLATVQHKTIGKLLDKIVQYRSEPKNVAGYNALRLELHARNKFSSDKDRRRIIEVFLDGNKTDRIYAYNQLYQNWDKYFLDRIITLYDKYHDGESLKLFIKHFPKNYLHDKFDAIAKHYNYSYAYYCMGAECVESIDKSKLHPDEYLRLMATFKREVPCQEAEDMLYGTIIEHLYQFLSYYDKNNASLLSVWDVKYIVRAIGGLGMKDSLVAFARICAQTEKILCDGLSDTQNKRNEMFDKIISLLPAKYQTTNAKMESEKELEENLSFSSSNSQDNDNVQQLLTENDFDYVDTEYFPLHESFKEEPPF